MTCLKACGVAGFVLVVGTAGCVTPQPAEQLMRASRPVRPLWVRETPPPAEGYEYFVGRSVAVNVLDERRALVRAKHDAAYDIAMSIMAEVSGASTWIDGQHGDEVRGAEWVDTYWDSQVKVLVSEILTGFREVESYWELWVVRDSPPGSPTQAFRRYKYYVLVKFPEEELARCREAVKKNGRMG
jgi:hypothetical protein